jgi:ParB family transcriptional regulator, chromosome partitioning protein
MPRKDSLGRGLGAMFPDLISHVGDRPSFVMCGIEELFPNRFQPRMDFNDAAQNELVASIKKNGVIQPIIVRKAENGYEIIAGERRWRAAQVSGLKDVPVIIRQATDRELAELSLVENIQRESLNPIEEARAYQTLVQEFSLSQEDISLRVGKDRSTIANTIRLLKLPEDIQRDLIDKKITTGHARALISLDSREQQIKTANLIKKGDLTVRKTENLINNIKKNRRRDNKKHQNQYLDDIQNQLSSLLLTSVKIRTGKRSGFIEIKYANPEELNRLIRLLLEHG